MVESTFSENRHLFSLPSLKKHALGGSFLILVVLFIGFLFYTTLSWMWDDQRLPLSKIVLQGDLTYVSASDVQHAFSQLEHIGTFMSQDIDVLQDSLEALPWVSVVSIRKQWPDTIKVFLTEHQAAAIWNGNMLLNENGDVFNGDIGQLEGDRVKLYGPQDSSQEVIAKWRQITPLINSVGLSVTSLVLNERRAWQIILDNGIRLELGKDSLDERVERFISLYNELGDKANRVSYIDLRYDTGAAVGWFPEQELEESTDD
ncbi:cell division protein FtsQ/DivIB [Vibrio fortis]|uniref:Cell division protein FtsQ n=1 Tax=Vibrio fortis TaxID=212667 RepID=A0A066URL4_9VIBR|nr:MULTISPECIES: cell division protein FtsQ/DivIB [Vibrio]KAB0286148.1 FtsQ-type POTRA domain-containing protein [Vibrio fortis]KDN26843.1 cell division protein [Vibrio fortis]MDK9737541.1 cell division protein FtsQ/DivIB [Vibrio sp. D404a]MDK9764092.1 cell division protein FtsQ/DivIB [Vibrio sp. D420a]MDK9797484.1 cell division protein FtsQ/DivIB [Vibrio sp. D449a]